MHPLQKIFTETPAESSVSYFWFINTCMDVELLKKQLHDMYDRHVRSVCLHPIPSAFRPLRMPTDMTPEYLSDEFFEVISAIVDECEKLGMQFYLYDEGGWPSGGACGQVLTNRPDLYERYLALDELGKIRECRVDVDRSVSAPLPDPLQKESTLEFLRLTHERYKEFAGRHFGKTMRFAFTDEPRFHPNIGGHVTWTRDMDRIFRERKGYDITPYLEALTREPHDGDPDETVNVRIDFLEVCTRLFVENYFLPIRDWCRANGLLSGGHVSREDEPAYSCHSDYGSVMKVLRALDLPGIDMIWRQLYPGLREHPFPKFASSVANQNGTPYAMAELFGACGNGLKPEEMLFYVNYFLVHGINIFVFGSYPLANKDNWVFGCRPHFGPDDPQWKYFDMLHDYTNRLSGIMAQGKPVRPAAVFFDIRTMWGGRPSEIMTNDTWLNRVSKRLFERQCGFDFLDEDVLAEAEICGTELHAGHAVYQEILLPPICRMTDDARRKLDAFIAAGGKVSSDAESAEPLIRIDPPMPRLRVEVRDLEDGSKLWFCFNNSREEMPVELNLPANGKLVWCDAESGRFFNLPGDGRFRWNFKKFGAALFLSGAEGETMPPELQTVKEIPLTGEWSLRKVQQYIFEKNRLGTVVCNDPAVPAAPGDWRKYIGNDFSGDAEYTLTFDWNEDAEEESVFLDLGEVAYACTVELNNTVLGRKYFGPYLFDTAGVLRKGRNMLKVSVTNTLANLYLSDEANALLQKQKSVAIYEPIQQAFERDSLVSGLLGPVKLRYCKYGQMKFR